VWKNFSAGEKIGQIYDLGVERETDLGRNRLR
jgi:hypothetical protein